MSVLYQVRHAIPTHQKLILKLYYFPLGTKKIQYGDILSFGTATQLHLNLIETKSWDMSLSPIWWACSPLIRCFDLDNQIGIKVRGCPIQCGFTSRHGNPA
jgi:hypothetical protein